MNRILKDESGMTALETAIILIAFVVVAAVFAFTIFQAQWFASQPTPTPTLAPTAGQEWCQECEADYPDAIEDAVGVALVEFCGAATEKAERGCEFFQDCLALNASTQPEEFKVPEELTQ